MLRGCPRTRAGALAQSPSNLLGVQLAQPGNRCRDGAAVVAQAADRVLPRRRPAGPPKQEVFQAWEAGKCGDLHERAHTIVAQVDLPESRTSGWLVTKTLQLLESVVPQDEALEAG